MSDGRFRLDRPTTENCGVRIWEGSDMRNSEQPVSIISILLALSVAFWADNLASFLDPATPVPRAFANLPRDTAVITLVSGVLFLLDILCVLWWYAKYIYRIKPVFTLGSHFLDFGVAGMFVLAANQWHEPGYFLGTTLIAVTLLSIRFYFIFIDPDATDTDKKILKMALGGLGFAAVIVVALGLLAFIIQPKQIPLATYETSILPASTGVLSLIGIALTFWLSDKIAIAAEIHDVSRRRFVSMHIHWPKGLAGDANAIMRIRKLTTEGLEEFHGLFEGRAGELSHEKLKSRVHPEADLRIQNYILSVPSWEEEPAQEEIKKKAFMVALSHWLDDLVDGRNEAVTFRKLRKLGRDYGLNAANSDIDNSEDLFKLVYRKLIIRYTNEQFYKELLKKIKESVVLGQNTKYLFWSLYQVAIGAVIFGSRVRETDREDVVDKHIQKLVRLVESSKADGGWKKDVTNILHDMQKTLVGQTLLGLTTKTVQDMAMASEGEDVDFALSLLYSLLYAPLLYFHDIGEELECGEMIPLDAFDVNYDLIIPSLWKIRELCERELEDPEGGVKDVRRDYRLQQLEMAYYCFESSLPKSVAKALKPIYDPTEEPPAGVIPFPAKSARKPAL